MGCFNKSCGLSGLQISHGEPIVGYKLTKSKYDADLITSGWYPSEFPIHGFYDDYGRIEDAEGQLIIGDEDADYDSTRCEDFMFVHKSIYDYVTNYKSEYVNTYHDDYVKEWEQEFKDAFEIEAEYEDYPNLNEKEKAAIYKYTHSTIISNLIERRIGGYLPVESSYYWKKKLHVVGNYEATLNNINRYRKEIGRIENYRFELGVQWKPSLIGNQEVYHNFRLGFMDVSKKIILDHMEKYAYDGDEENE